MDLDELERQFDEAMLNIYHRAKQEINYTATYYLQMLNEHRGVQTAKMLISSGKPSEGYTKLFMAGRLDLTVEALIHDNPEWHPLFNREELDKVTKRLSDYRYLKSPHNS